MSQKFIKITRPNIRKLQPGQRLAEHGIEVDCLKNWDIRFSINIMVNGERVHRRMGTESQGVTLTEAQELLEKLKTDARHGRLNLPKGRKLHLTFQEAADKYLKRLEEGNGKDIEPKRQRLKDHLTPFFGSMIISKISTFDVDRYKKTRMDKGPAPGTVNRELQTLSHLLSMAVEWDWIQYKPCKIRKLKENEGRITYLTQKQISRLYKEAKNDTCPYIYPFVHIGLETGMRRMEILSIRIEDIDVDKRTIQIPKAKAGARTQPMTADLAKYLKDYLKGFSEQKGWLFPAISKTGHTMEIKKQFKRVVEAAKLDATEVSPHVMRHTAISHLVQAGVDLPTIKLISGHHSIQMVERYSHQDGNHIKAAMDKLAKRYQGRRRKAKPDNKVTPLHQNYTKRKSIKNKRGLKPTQNKIPQTGFEPVTYRLEGGCSIQLSY